MYDDEATTAADKYNEGARVYDRLASFVTKDDYVDKLNEYVVDGRKQVCPSGNFLLLPSPRKLNVN